MTIFFDSAPRLAGAVVTLTILAYLMFGLRLYTRLKKSNWGLDDWCMSAAAFPFAVLSASCLLGSWNGIGIHNERFKEPGNAKYEEIGLKWFFMFEVFYCVTVIPIKLSIAFTLIRIARGRKQYVYSQYAVMFMFTAMNLIAAFYIIFQCDPVSYAWNTNQPGKCNPSYILADIYYATTAVNIATDWFCAILPVPLLWNVKLNRNAKISVAGILSLGIFASLSACIRLKYTVNLNNSNDYLYGVADIAIWGYAENGIGMIVGCISTLRPLFRRMFNLGGSDNPSTPHAISQRAAWPGNSRRGYKEFETGYELKGGEAAGAGAGSSSTFASDKYAGIATQTTRIKGGLAPGRSGSFSSDSESQKQILSDERGIMVSHHVNISHC